MIAATLAQLFAKTPGADDPQWTHYLLLAGVTLITVGLLMRLRKRKRQSALRPDPREQVEQNKQMRGMHGDLEGLMVEIEQLARRFGAQLDAKTLQMEQLIKQAEKTIEQLQALNEQGAASRGGGGRIESGDAAAPEQTSPPSPSDPLARSVYELTDRGLASEDIARQLDEHIGKVELILALRSAS